MKSIVLIFTVFLLINNLGYTQSGYQKAVDRFAQQSIFDHAQLSVAVVDVKSGKRVAGVNANKSLTPASSLKVVTTGCALATLGADFQFKTELQYSGEIDPEGVLNGNLYIKGYGDPTLGSDHFGATPDLDELLKTFVGAIEKAGIKKIDGYIIGDASWFDTDVNGRGWLWEDLGNYYGAGAWGLNIQENRYFIEFQQNVKLGGRPKLVKHYPTVPNLELFNEVKSAKKGSGDNAYIFNSPYNYVAFVRGTIPVGSERFVIKGAVPDPPFVAAHWLMAALADAGISTTQLATSQFERNRLEKDSKRRTTFYSHLSPKLSEVIKVTNLKSVNLYCEAMLKTMGKNKKGEGSVEKGLEVVMEYLEGKGFSSKGFFMEDGSGLAPMNGVSGFHLASALSIFAKDAKVKDHLYGSLPEAGKSGGVKYLLRNTPAVGKLRAKSGGMKRVRSYSGYFKDAKGTLYSFSAIANNYTGKSSAARNALKQLMVDFCR